MAKKIIPFFKSDIGQEEVNAVTRVMKSGMLAAGKETEMFEKEFANFIGVKYAIFTNSGTSALKMAYKYFKEEEGYKSYLLKEPNTFCATYSAAEEVGLYSSMNWRDNPVIVAVHYGGVKNKDAIIDLEDSAHRIEPNDPLIGEIRIYSFYPTKNITAIHGGMLVTNDKKIYEKCRLYWNDGIDNKSKHNYKVVEMAGGYDANDVYAAVGRVQLKRLPLFNKRRQEILDRYNEGFGKNWQGKLFYPISKDQKMLDWLKKQGIQSRLFYPPDGFVCLPVYPELKNSEIDYIIKKVKEYENSII